MSPKSLNAHPAERVDLDDYLHGAVTFPRAVQSLQREILVLDNQARVLRGFQIEVPDQSQFPGRIVVHAGAAIDPTGQMLFNDDQRNVSRTVTLEGASTHFWVELEFTESESDVDDRAFWDPTVDQGTDPSGDPRPDGQEYSNNVTTRNSPDWRVVSPIRTGASTGFTRRTSPNSTKVPLLYAVTDANNQITLTGVTPRTTLLEVVATSPGQIRVQDPTHFGTGDIELGTGLSAPPRETLTVATVDYDAGLITFTGNIVNSHSPGEIIQRVDAGAPSLLFSGAHTPRYAAPAIGARSDNRDFLFRGDENHGEILSEGHDPTPADPSDDVNLQSLKGYIDFLAAQVQELKWGHRNPATPDNDPTRMPPGVVNALPATPRYYHKVGGIQGARQVSITVGDGTQSWGDFVGTDQTGLVAALANAPTDASIYIKRGSYTFTSDVVVSKGVQLIFDHEAQVLNEGGGFDLQIPVTDDIVIHGLNMSRSGSGVPTTRGLYFNGTVPSRIELYDCSLQDVNIDVAIALPKQTYVRNCEFGASAAAMALVPLVYVSAVAGTLRGLWDKCVFTHASALAANSACVDADFINPTIGADSLTFRDCNFNSWLINGATVAIDGGYYVRFERCQFNGLLAHTTGHLNLSGSVNNVAVVECEVIDNQNRLVYANTVNLLVLERCKHFGGVTKIGALLEAVNCSRVAVRNCATEFAGSTSLTQCAIKITTTGASLFWEITGNHFTAASDDCTGIIFDITSGTDGMGDILIADNHFENFEVSLYFLSTTGASGSYRDVQIQGNNFSDRLGGWSTASYQRLPILTGSSGNFDEFNVSGNQFVNINPPDSTLVAGHGRAAVWVNSNAASDWIIKGNDVSNVGDPSNPTVNTAAFVFADGNNVLIEGNKVTGVYGADANGVILTLSINQCSACTVKGNYFNTIQTTAGGNYVWGVYFYGAQHIVIADNMFQNLQNLGGGALQCGCIGFANNAGSLLDATITGNSYFGALTNESLVAVSALNIANVTITGNSTRSVVDYGVFLYCAPGGTLYDIAVTGNSFAGVASMGIKLSNNTGTGARFTITGNHIFHDASLCRGIEILDCDFFVISGNMIYSNQTGANAFNINLSNCNKFSIVGNVLRTGGGAGGYTINMSGCNLYFVAGNINDQNANASGTIINNTAANYGLLAHNLIDQNAGGVLALAAGAGYNASGTVWGVNALALTTASGDAGLKY